MKNICTSITQLIKKYILINSTQTDKAFISVNDDDDFLFTAHRNVTFEIGIFYQKVGSNKKLF